MIIDLHKKDGYLYENLYQEIKDKIIEGQIKEGDKLPSIRTLSRDLGLSLNTVKQAYYQLEIEGYIESKYRVGFFCRQIDNLIILDQGEVFVEEESKEINIKYNFTFSGVDKENFPYGIWRKMMKESVEEGDESLVERGHYKGNLSLRKAICKYLKRSRNIITKANNIIISSGTEALFDLVKNLLRPGSLYAFENPGYAFGNKFFTHDLINPIPLKVDQEGVNISHIEDINSCCLFVTPYNQFPMGTVMSIQRRVDLLNWASKSKNRYIIEDDYESEFKFIGRPVQALKAMDKNDDVIYMGSFSKIISPALRISYMVLPNDLLKIYEDNFKSLGCPVSLYIQKATGNFISQGYFERHINRMKNIYHEKYKLMVEKLSRIDKIEIVSQTGSLTIVIRLLIEISSDIFIKALEEKGVRIRKLKDYSYRKEGPDDLYILGFASMKKDEIDQGLDIISQTIQSLSFYNKG